MPNASSARRRAKTPAERRLTWLLRTRIDTSDLRTLAKSIQWDVLGAPAVYVLAERIAERIERGESCGVAMEPIHALLMLSRCGNQSCVMRALDTARPPCECAVCAAYRRLHAWLMGDTPIDAKNTETMP
jgi:hypothetical protein